MSDGYDFNDDNGLDSYEDSESEDATAETAAGIVEQLMAPDTEASDEPADYMAEVDRRLDVAAFYRQLLRGSLFEGDSASAAIVEAEVRQFAVQRLEVLLNIRSEPVKVVEATPLFTDLEVQTLRILLQQLVKKGMLPAAKVEVQAPPPPPTPKPPTIKRVAAPAPITPPTVTKRVAPAVMATPSRPPVPVKKKPGRKPGAQTKVVAHPDDGRPVTMNLTKQVQGTGAVPFPPDMHAAMHSAASASTHAASAALSGNKGLAAAVAASLNG